MADPDPSDLKALPWKYQSSRSLNDVLVGEDTGYPLINASSTGNITALSDMLEQYPEIALASPHRIYAEDHPASDKDDMRGVLAMKRSNLGIAILQAAENGHAAAVTALLDFASRNDIKASSVIDRKTVHKTITNGHVAVLEVLAAAAPKVALHDDLHGNRPLDFAIKAGRVEIARVILQRCACRELSIPGYGSSYGVSRLCKAARSRKTTMIELLIQHGYVVKGSGALQMAAECGALDTIRLLVERHGADVNERLPAETVQRVNNALFASWTPLHFAARWGREEAIELLKSYGASEDILDCNGKTPSQLLDERKGKSKQ
ncbi:hypothetical protein B5807_08346 [Epicoccum nigrum]|jgi:hypothetical protein|uniref:Uncharacterized protein n=1 Tax=Epicoccum nigrum TaxID=105696 RepID=A0A1Y2LS07_EPING|nr:hypothetical protein B5807_08346 [Epicoccum nigrum]